MTALAYPEQETAFAKVNLALHVRRRRADGFHDIESLFAFAQDGDRLSARAREDGALHLSIEGPFGAALDAGDSNLVLLAARKLRDASGTTLGADMLLDKRLPVASGIGGGSADAAAALRMLARLWTVSPDSLLAIAASLGSDVPACLVSRTLVGTGRGEALDMRTLPGLAGTPMLLVNPGVPLSTAPVFSGWDQVDHGALNAESVEAIIAVGRNDLQWPAIALVPQIAQVLDLLKAQPGVRLARMSGSGATCFALFEDDTARDSAVSAISIAHPDWWMMATMIKGA